MSALERQVEELYEHSIRSTLMKSVLNSNVEPGSAKFGKVKLPPFKSTVILTPGLGAERHFGEEVDVWKYANSEKSSEGTRDDTDLTISSTRDFGQAFM